uniref:Uncharacterized protein n=1 Tax=Panagrolaimus sp. JU765 TaxID=591449 RepID=A0AC34QD23_9BILA
MSRIFTVSKESTNDEMSTFEDSLIFSTLSINETNDNDNFTNLNITENFTTFSTTLEYETTTLEFETTENASIETTTRPIRNVVIYEDVLEPFEIFQCIIMFFIMLLCFMFSIVMAKKLRSKEAEMKMIYEMTKDRPDDPVMVDLRASEDSMFNASQILEFPIALIPPLNKKLRRRSRSSISANKTTDKSSTSRSRSPFKDGFEAFKRKFKRSKTKKETTKTVQNDEVAVEFAATTAGEINVPMVGGMNKS